MDQNHSFYKLKLSLLCLSAFIFLPLCSCQSKHRAAPFSSEEEAREETRRAEEYSTREELPSLSETSTEEPEPTKADKFSPVFTSEEIPDQVFQRMKGYSYGADCTTRREDLRYLTLSYYGFDNEPHLGEMIVNKGISQDVLEIFEELYEIRYPIEKIRLIDEYKGEDEASMEDNNTSCFNFRLVPGKKSRSKHSYGLAIDINPLYNPYIRTVDGQVICSPENGAFYQNRNEDFPYKITTHDPCYEIFISHGFTWGGSWNSEKDYQHFAKNPDQ